MMPFLWYNFNWGDVMKKYLAIALVVFSSIGVLITVFTVTFGETTNLWRGLGMFRYYTIQSNLIVSIYFSMYLIKDIKNNELFQRLIGGVTIYISITFLVFLLFLQSGYHPTGWSFVSNILLHYLVPLLTITFLVVSREEAVLKFKDPFIWVLYPFLYLIFVIIYGSITGDYIYPFFQVGDIGILGLIFTIIQLVGFFFILSFILMKMVSKKVLTKQQ